MNANRWPIVLGSRSPRRFELLAELVGDDRIQVMPPLNSDEQGFEDLQTQAEFEDRIREVVLAKQRDVLKQIEASHPQLSHFFVVSCDTTVVASRPDGRPVSLGQPEETGWQQTVRDWFLNYYAGRSHSVMSCLCISRMANGVLEAQTSISTTRVTMHESLDNLDWYLSTHESVGKAGGYAIQGLASIFVKSIAGSLSNVVGLPLEETTRILRSFHAI